MEKTAEEIAHQEKRRAANARWRIRLRSDPKRYAEYKRRRAEWQSRNARRRPKNLPLVCNPLGIRLSSSWVVGGEDGPIPRRL